MQSSVSKAAGAFVAAGAMAATMRVVRIKKTFPFVAIRPGKHVVQPPRSAAVGAVVHRIYACCNRFVECVNAPASASRLRMRWVRWSQARSGARPVLRVSAEQQHQAACGSQQATDCHGDTNDRVRRHQLIAQTLAHDHPLAPGSHPTRIHSQ